MFSVALATGPAFGLATAATAAEPSAVPSANSYADLLEPIPNAAEKLKLADQQEAQNPARLIKAQWAYGGGYAHHHHHHHHHHHANYYAPPVNYYGYGYTTYSYAPSYSYAPYGYYGRSYSYRPYVRRRVHHHHHHHHHSNYYRR